MSGYKSRKPRKTAATTDARRTKVVELRARLAEWKEGADEGMIAAALALHDGYSERNAMLIAAQDPQATDVAGFKAWLDRGRCVRKGEHGIMILAPAGSYTEAAAESADAGDHDGGAEGSDSKISMRFRVAYVFDVRQTDALDEVPASRPYDANAADANDLAAQAAGV